MLCSSKYHTGLYTSQKSLSFRGALKKVFWTVSGITSIIRCHLNRTRLWSLLPKKETKRSGPCTAYDTMLILSEKTETANSRNNKTKQSFFLNGRICTNNPWHVIGWKLPNWMTARCCLFKRGAMPCKVRMSAVPVDQSIKHWSVDLGVPDLNSGQNSYVQRQTFLVKELFIICLSSW